jgi:hypothetical protein
MSYLMKSAEFCAFAESEKYANRNNPTSNLVFLPGTYPITEARGSQKEDSSSNLVIVHFPTGLNG